MAFKRVGSLIGGSNIEYLKETANEAYSLGEALVLTNGTATKCGATQVPEFICLANHAANSGKPIPAERVREDIEYAAVSTATVAATKIGTAVTLHTDGLSPTATGTNGVFLISATDGAKNVKGYFRRIPETLGD